MSSVGNLPLPSLPNLAWVAPSSHLQYARNPTLHRSLSIPKTAPKMATTALTQVAGA